MAYRCGVAPNAQSTPPVDWSVCWPVCAATFTRCRHLGLYFLVIFSPLLNCGVRFAANLLSLPLTGTAILHRELPPLSDMVAESPSQPPFASRVV